MRLGVYPIILLILLVGWGSGAYAHSLEELQSILGDKEKYFQPLDKPAPNFTLQRADGTPVSLADMRGKVIVLNFVYTSCPDVCPLHTALIAELQSMFNQTPMKTRVELISITTDPKRDAKQVLLDYGVAHGLDPSNWMFLTASPAQAENTTRNLAEAYGHKFTKTKDGYQMHGIVTHVIDREGRWRANFYGLEFQPVNLVLFVNALTNDAHIESGHSKKGFWRRIRDWFR